MIKSSNHRIFKLANLQIDLISLQYTSKDMKISFDLDDTLIAGAIPFDEESQNIIQKCLRMEKLRKGTLGLFQDLRAQGHEVCIYTTSLRSTFIIRLTFWLHGIYLRDIYNKTIHDRHIRGMSIHSSKYPPLFGIALHVDDSEGLRKEGEKYNFKTIIIKADDADWVNQVLMQCR
jgi:hypothetical protein